MSEDTEATAGKPAAADGATQERTWSDDARAAAAKRRKIVIGVLVGVIVVALGLIVWLQTRPDPDPVVLPPVPGPTVTGPTPTSTIAPVERDKSTELLAAIPDTVLRWSVTGQTVLDPGELAAVLNPDGVPVEAYELTYTDGENELTLGASLWRSPEQAATAAGNVQQAGETVRDEDVLVGGEVVGHVTVRDFAGDVPSQGVVWTNGSVLFTVTAPPGMGLPFYDAFGM